MNAKSFLFGLPLLLICLLSSCIKDQCQRTITYAESTPIQLAPEEYRHEISIDPPKTLSDQGQLYFYQDYILINELRKGIHFIDNHILMYGDPSYGRIRVADRAWSRGARIREVRVYEYLIQYI